MKKDELEKLACSGSRIDAIVAVIGEFTEDMHRDRCEAYETAKYLSEKMSSRVEPLFVPDDGDYSLEPDEKSLKGQFKIIRAALRENFSEEKVRFACHLIDLMRAKSTSSPKCERCAEKDKSATIGESSISSGTSGINDLYGKADGEQKISVIDMKVAIIGELSDDRHRSVPRALKVADEAQAQLQKYGLSLFDVDDGDYPVDLVAPGTATEAEFKKLRAALRENFSREKLQRAVWLIRDLRDQRNPNFEIKPEAVSVNESESRESGVVGQNMSETSDDSQTTESPSKVRSSRVNKGKHVALLVWSAVVVAIGVIVAAIIKFVK